MGVRSEYQKHFKVSALRKSLPIYYENVAFRTARREREYAHTPLSWCDEEDADSVDTDDVENDGEQQPDIEDTDKTSGEKFTEAESADSLAKENPLSVVEKTVSDQKMDNKHDTVIPDEQDIKQSQTQNGSKSETLVVKPGRQRRPDRRQEIAPRPKQHKSTSHSKRPTTVEHPAPFVSYGWGDKERDLCQHKTFNVRAKVDVHPAALRAQSRRKTSSERRAESVKKSAEDRVKAMLEVAARERAQQGVEWRSEYQLQYPAYDASEYLRSISARANDRKLDRVVYVP